MSATISYTPPRVDERPNKKLVEGAKVSEDAALQGNAPSSGAMTSDRLLSSDSLADREDVTIFGSAPLQPSSTVENFASAMALAMATLARIRAKTSAYDSEASANRLEAVVKTVKAKIKTAQEAADSAVINAQIAETLMKSIKLFQAIMAIIGILTAILLAALTIAVSIFTLGAGTMPMIAATVGAVGALLSGVTAGGLALSDAVRTDGKSWFDDLAKKFIGEESSSNSAAKNAEIRKKREQLRITFAVLEGLFQAVFAIISFGAGALSSVANAAVAKTIQAVLRAIMQMITQNLAKFALFFTSLSANLALKIFASMLQSGALARILAGNKAKTALEDATEKKKNARWEELKNSSTFHALSLQYGEKEAEKTIKNLLDQEQQAIIHGDVDKIVAIKEQFLSLTGQATSAALKEKFQQEAKDSIIQGSIFAKDHYADLIAETNSQHQNMTMGIMIALSVVSFVASLASSAISMKHPSSLQAGDVDAQKSVSSIANAQAWAKRMQTVQFALSILTGIMGTALSIQEANTESASIEQQKQVRLFMMELKRKSLIKDFELFLQRLLVDSSFEIQKANLETFKHLGNIFSDFWSSVANTFAVGLGSRV